MQHNYSLLALLTELDPASVDFVTGQLSPKHTCSQDQGRATMVLGYLFVDVSGRITQVVVRLEGRFQANLCNRS